MRLPTEAGANMLVTFSQNSFKGFGVGYRENLSLKGFPQQNASFPQKVPRG
jgi:hypothetical protein